MNQLICNHPFRRLAVITMRDFCRLHLNTDSFAGDDDRFLRRIDDTVVIHHLDEIAFRHIHVINNLLGFWIAKKIIQV